ncbi:MAG TPA: Asp-tRNA(Asn)/Glu-tRNA(Gln) amidotransferase subunit GatB [bacterium]|jgi:aspartyl-tRNA(Asn)/glutamyl-tRNA(Gln) amidotransferase subunit B|nr:Asp-tRNA(Asn)/Glu-tRNA(Gln) amidotransferase subunit GatB [bacterium]
MPLQDYEIVVGLEVHAELSTKTKIFCSCANRFGADPNTLVCPVCLALPGTLPVLNQDVVVRAAKAGMALNCEINPYSKFDRKQYFYPDLDKAYQISQFNLPICGKGWLEADVEEAGGAVRKRFGVTRIHLEEDAGKLLHTGAAQIGGSEGSLVDFNRAGVPLIEIVSEPDMRGPEDAEGYLAALKEILRYLGVSDCNMEEGSLRCDANISVRKPGAPLGTRIEVKNMNSFKNVGKAIVSEAARQVELIEAGGTVVMATRSWDADQGATRAMRSKEEAHDYRYFPEPDLVPIELDAAWIAAVRAALPELPEAMRRRLVETYALPPYDAQVLTENSALAAYFEGVVKAGANPKAASNWVMGELLAALKRLEKDISGTPIPPENLAKMLRMVDAQVISGKIAKTVFEEMASGGGDPGKIVERLGLVQVTDHSAIDGFARAAMDANPAVVAEYRAGKEAVLGFLVGQVMKLSKGKANPALVNDALRRLLQA